MEEEEGQSECVWAGNLKGVVVEGRQQQLLRSHGGKANTAYE
jgi:hypothetical protein